MNLFLIHPTTGPSILTLTVSEAEWILRVMTLEEVVARYQAQGYTTVVATLL